MPVRLETLESRALFSATVGTDVLTTDLANLKVELKAAAVTAKVDAGVVAAATAHLPKTAANKKAVATLKHDQATAAANVAKAGAKLTAAAQAAGHNKAFATAYLGYELNPDDPTAAGKLAAALTSFASTLAAPSAALGTAATAGQGTVAADLSALSAANPSDAKLTAAVAKANADMTASTTGIGTTLVQTQTDLTTFVAQLKATAAAG